MTDPVRVFAVIMITLALVSMTGYAFHIPGLYAQVDGVGMSFNTSVGFLLCGLSFIHMRREKK